MVFRLNFYDYQDALKFSFTKLSKLGYRFALNVYLKDNVFTGREDSVKHTSITTLTIKGKLPVPCNEK